MCHCTSYLVYTFPLHSIHPLIISHFSTRLDGSAGACVCVGGGLPEDERCADVGGECLANKHFTCMEAGAHVRTATYTHPPPPTEPPNTHVAWKAIVLC